jgi:hypothetical protein
MFGGVDGSKQLTGSRSGCSEVQHEGQRMESRRETVQYVAGTKSCAKGNVPNHVAKLLTRKKRNVN